MLEECLKRNIAKMLDVIECLKEIFMTFFNKEVSKNVNQPLLYND